MWLMVVLPGIKVGETGACGDEGGDGGVRRFEVDCAAVMAMAGKFGNVGVEGSGSAEQAPPSSERIRLKDSNEFEEVACGESSGGGGVIDGETGGVISSTGISKRSDTSPRQLNLSFSSSMQSAASMETDLKGGVNGGVWGGVNGGVMGGVPGKPMSIS
jgi:hypothetical protein